MKEDKKKTTAKKTSTKKSSAAAKKNTTKVAAKKTTTKKSVAKKAPAKKATAAKKVVKKAPAKVAVKPVVEKVEEVKVANEVKVSEEKETLNKNLVMRAILLMAYTLIIVFLVIGFVDSLTKNASESPKRTISSYVKTGNVLEKSNIIDLEDASFKLSALNGDYFIYISYTDKNVNVFERDLIKLFNNKKLKGKLYYVNVDEIKDEENMVSLVNKYLSFKDALVNKVPSLVYVNKENIIRSENIVAGSGDKLLSINEVENLLDRNGF